MALHDVEEQRCLTGRAAKLPTTECGIPGSLRFVKDDDVLVRWLRSIDVVPEESHERLNGAFGPLSRHTKAAPLLMCVTGECLAHDMHQRQIAGQKRGAGCRVEHDVQPTECLAGAGDAGDEKYDVAQVSMCRLDRSSDRIGGSAQIADVGARRGYFCDTMAIVQHRGGFNYGRYGAIRRRFPCPRIERASRSRQTRCQLL